MPLLGQAVLAIWNDVAKGGDDEFNRWQVGEHIPERVDIPGFLRGRRYTALRAARRYFTLYETETARVLNGPEYLARLNAPTPGTQRCIPLFRNHMRTACRVVGTLGRGIRGVLATLDLGPAPGAAPALRAWLTATALPALVRAGGIVGAHLCEADPDVTRVQAAEKALLDRPDELARWVVMVEGSDVAAVERACATSLATETLSAQGTEPAMTVGIYGLVYVLGREG